MYSATNTYKLTINGYAIGEGISEQGNQYGGGTITLNGKSATGKNTNSSTYTTNGPGAEATINVDEKEKTWELLSWSTWQQPAKLKLEATAAQNYIFEGFTQENINTVMRQLEKPYIRGLSILGGEPLEYQNQEGLLPLLRQVKAKHPEKDIWCYTGFKFDEDVVGKMFKSNPYTKEFMSYIDVVVDGKYEENNKDLKIKFRGSTNQRIIDVKKSLEENKVVEFKV